MPIPLEVPKSWGHWIHAEHDPDGTYWLVIDGASRGPFATEDHLDDALDSILRERYDADPPRAA